MAWKMAFQKSLMSQNAISIILSASSIAFMLAAWIVFPSRPSTYISLDSNVSASKYSESGLKALHFGTVLSALIQAGLTVYFLYPVVGLGIEVSLPFILSSIGWAFIAIASAKINQVPNSIHGGHFSLFLVLILLGSANFLSNYDLFASLDLPYNRDQIVALSQTGITIILFFVYGFWRHRHEADDAEFISKESGASIFSKLSFSWVSPLIKEGNSRSLEQADLWGLLDDDRADLVLEEYRKNRNSTDSLTWRIFKFCYPYIIYQNICSLLSSFLQFAGPLFLLKIISALEVPDVDRTTIIPSLLGLFFCSVIQFIINGQVFFTGRRVGTRARIILIEELYTKSLHRVEGTGTSSSEDDEQASLGKIVTLMSVDTERIREFLCYIHDPIVHIPVIIIISITSLFFVLGWSAIAGVIVIIILGPISTLLGKMIIDIQEEQLQNTDSRVSIMNELLQGIRIVKYFAWENYFKTKVEQAREKELASIVKLWKVYIAYGIIGHGSGIIIAFATFFVHVIVFGNRLSASTAFTAINLLNIVRQGIMYLPSAIMQIFKAKVSMDRIETYLNEKDIAKHSEKDKRNSDEISESGTATETLIGFHNAEFRYYNSEEVLDGEVADNANPPFILRNLNVEFPDQKLSVICGPTGSGKSSLLLALLGEMECISGQYFLPKSDKVVVDPVTGLTNTVAYAAQSAWLLNATIRDNILFGEEYDAKRYEAVVRGCALVKDFENLDGGDLTEIGEKGINVSGGQKQRISLARACYSRSAIVFLDDPLSAVDAPTARFLLHKCVLGLLKGRTVLLVSHATHLVVPFADCVVFIKNGEIVSSGTPAEVTKNPQDESLFGLDLTQDTYEEEEESSDVAVATAIGGGTQLVDEEEKSSGSVKFSVYKSYFVAAGGLLFLLLFVIGFVLTTSSSVGNDWWLKVWTDHNAEVYGDEMATSSYSETTSTSSYGTYLPSVWSSWYIPSKPEMKIHTLVSTNPEEDANTIFYLSIYACFGLGVILAGTIQDVIVLLGALWASRKLHRELLDAVLFSPLRFFETTPVGRILNRFSKDIENIDSNVINTIYYFIYSVIRSVTVVAVIGSIAPPFLIIVPIIGALYLYVAQLYLNTSRELKRLEAISRSPIYSQFSETLSGVSTIRAYEAEPRFIVENLKKIDENHKPFFYMWAANRWLCLRTDLLSAVVVLFAGLNVVFGGVGAGWAALTITYALDFTDALLWTVRMHAEMEMSMNSVERIEEYTAIEQEPPAVVEHNRPTPEWPQEGVIEVRDLSMRYAPDLPDVLKGINFSVNPHEKVAVVGRTGAGKSTLSLAFFRIIPLSSGSIVIDGNDISSIGLYDLRSRLTIIPQDPVLFNGTLRSNLDPLEENDDESLWEALKRVNFTDSIQQSSSTTSSSLLLIQDGDQTINSTTSTTSNITLDYNVAENGSNFSQGQRQLLCLARSLLQRNKIIFLDEATASVDNETDAKIQATIRREFKDSTIICIAHRLRTIIDYDKILVLDKGEVKEFGTPLDLIEAGGQFRSMCEETGEFDELYEIARQSQSK